MRGNLSKFLCCCGDIKDKVNGGHVKLVCRGTIHQGDLQNGGRQCMCVALCFLALPSPQTPAELDHNLKLGTILYTSMCPNGGYLMPLDFHNTVKSIGDHYYNITTDEPKSGMVFLSEDNLDALFFTLNSAIRLCFQESSTCLLTVGNSPGSTIGIKIGEDKSFLIGDSHSRDSKGRCTSNGKAVVLKVGSQYDLVEYIKTMASSLSTSDIPFECTPVQICKTNQQVTSEQNVSPATLLDKADTMGKRLVLKPEISDDISSQSEHKFDPTGEQFELIQEVKDEISSHSEHRYDLTSEQFELKPQSNLNDTEIIQNNNSCVKKQRYYYVICHTINTLHAIKYCFFFVIMTPCIFLGISDFSDITGTITTEHNSEAEEDSNGVTDYTFFE